ncbi:caspase family protein [Streptomyces sp. NPDC059070]|uniref:HD domain-containing protein n=1 Tax=Streptomyces sp. NPDC059070 TaxID=3346713 RepID=UPI00369871CB
MGGAAGTDGARGGDDGTTGARRALVLGVPETRFLRQDPALADRFPALECVERDIEAVSKALEQSAYAVAGADPGDGELTRSLLLRRLREFFRSCAPGDLAFVYLSCHGESLGERDYLVPADAQPGDELPGGGRALLVDTLLPADPEKLLGGLRPDVTAVICLDICRTAGPGPAERATARTDGYDNVLWLYGSAPGAPSYADPVEGSYFGRALAEALAPTSHPTTFGEVVAYTRTAVRRLTRRLTVPPPAVTPSVAHLRQGWAFELPLCTGSREALAWTDSVLGSGLWEHTSGSPETHRRIKDKLSDLARLTAESRAGSGAHTLDPWGDPRSPVRIERQLSALVREARLCGSERLSPAETAALLAAPLVHEGLVAVALDELAELLPDRLDPEHAPRVCGDHAAEVRDAARDVCRAHSQVGIAAETLRRRHLDDAASAADHWLRHRFIADWDRLWESDGQYEAMARLLALAAEAVAAGAEDSSAAPAPDARRLIGHQLRQVLAHLTVAPGGSPRINETDDPDQWSTFRAVRGNQWRGEELAHLLWTAGLLAADPRRMSSVLVDHLGAHRPLVPRGMVAALSENFDYETVDREAGATGEYGLAVSFRCPHPALHAAVEELAATADAWLHALRRRWKGGAPPPLLRGLPAAVTTEYLVPQDGRYTKPLERFRLAEDEIRPLLMGTQLYGDKMLAVRELYQNALDACRHRSLRVEYRRALGGSDSGWTPRISFAQGWDPEGRPYIECEDNGTGMSWAKLTSMFARAGKRYEQDPDFVQERRNWRRAKIADIGMNSRFGIGVFSYFMLAEEVVVWTAPVDQHGLRLVDRPHQAEIQSGSGLLQIRETDDAPARGGTRVRLYLSAQDGEPPSLVEALKSLLWVSDHPVSAVEYGRDGTKGRSGEWEPGVLGGAAPDRLATALPAGPDAWVVQGAGQLLLDGVVIKDAPEVFGHVFNLREKHSPVPSVDRNRLLSCDEDLVMDTLLAAAGEAVADCEEVPLRWLWELAEKTPRLALAVLEGLPREAVGILKSEYDDYDLSSSRVPLARAGCLPLDKVLIKRRHYLRRLLDMPTYERELLHEWRWGHLGIAGKWGALDVRPAGYPEPVGLDSLLLRTPQRGPWYPALTAAAESRLPLDVALRHQRRYAIAGVAVPPVPDGVSLADIPVTGLMAALAAAYHDAARSARTTPALHAPLLAVAAQEGVSLAEAAAALRVLNSLAPALPAAPDLDGPLGDEHPSIKEANLLGAQFINVLEPEEYLWRDGRVSPVELLLRAPSAAEHAQLVRRIEQLAPLGFSLARPRPDPLPHRRLSGQDRRLLGLDSPLHFSWNRGAVGPLHLLRLSADSQVPVGVLLDTWHELAPAVGAGPLDLPEEVRAWTAPRWFDDACHLVADPGQPLGPWTLVAALWQTSQDVDASRLKEDLRLLELCGVLSEDCVRQLDGVERQWSDRSRLLTTLLISDLVTQNRVARARHVSVLDASGLQAAQLLQISARERMPLGQLLRLLYDTEQHVALAVPDIPSASEVLTATAQDVLALTDSAAPAGFRTRLTIHQLFRHARNSGQSLGETVRALSRFTPLGAPPVPGDFSGPDAAALEDLRPALFDFAAFDPGLLGPGLLGPLELVLVAGRFGWTLGRAYERYAPFRCLGLDVTVREPDARVRETVPDWRDVIVLTTGLTGRAPAVAGAVDPDHLARCAAGTDLAEDGVRERLTHYAELFGLTLPPTESPDA